MRIVEVREEPVQRPRPTPSADAERLADGLSFLVVMADAAAGHSVSVAAIVMMNALFLIGLTYKVLTKRFLVTWDSAAIGGVYVVAVVLSYVLTA